MPVSAAPRRELARRLGWRLVWIGFGLGSVALGMVLLLGSELAEAIQGLRAGRSMDAVGEGRSRASERDSFYLWGWAFLGATIVSAVASDFPAVGLATSAGFGLLFWLMVKGAATLRIAGADRGENAGLGPSVESLAFGLLVAGALGSLYAVGNYALMDLPRAVGVVTKENGLGSVSSVVALAGLGHALTATGWKARLLGLAALLLSTGALVASLSRGAWVGSAAGLALYLCITAVTGRLSRKATVMILAATVAVLAGVAFLSPEALERAATIVDLEANSDRLFIWKASLNMIQAHPLIGVGGGAYPFLYEAYRLPEDPHVFAFAHNMALHVMAEFGVVGLVPFVGMVGIALRRGWRLALRGGPFIASLYAGYVSLIVHDMFDNVTHGVSVGGFFWLLTGLFAAFGRADQRPIPSSIDR